jgi:hypothetical protein
MTSEIGAGEPLLTGRRIKTSLLRHFLPAEIHCARGDQKRAQFNQRKPKYEARKPLNQLIDSKNLRASSEV